MAVPSPGKCFLIPIFLVLTAGLFYTAYGFRVRDQEVCHSGRCPPSPWPGQAGIRAKRGFETASARGNFAKKPPADELETVAKKVTPGKLWSKLTKIEDDAASVSDDEDDYGEDEIVQIEVEDDSEDEEDASTDDKVKLQKEEEERKKKEEEEKKLKKEREEQETRQKEELRRKKDLEEQRKRIEDEMKKKKEREDEERRKREEEVRRKREEAEKLLIQEAEKRLQEEQERRRLEEEEEKKAKEEEERKVKELEEAERKRKEEERRRELEEAEKKKKEEERRKVLEEAEKKRKEDERKRKEEEKRKKELEEAEKKKKDEEKKKKQLEEAEKKRKEEEKRKKELAEAEKKRKDEEKKQKDLEDAEKKKKDEDEDAEKKRDAVEDKKRVLRLKKEVEDAKKREEERKKMKTKPKDDSSAENEDDEQAENEDEESRNEEDEDDSDYSKRTPAEGEDESLDENIEEGDDELEELDDDDQEPDDEVEELDDDTEELDGEDESMEKLVESKEEKRPVIKKTHPELKVERGDKKVLSLLELNDMILSVPTFVPNFTAVENPVCQRHGKIFLRQLRGLKLWALQMLDSSAKIPSGLLRGNVNQLGDFDQCLGVAAHVVLDEETTLKVHGKYCLANVDLHPVHPNADVPVNLLQSRALIKGNLSDPGHFVPKFTTANWALCLPAACTAEDAQIAVEDALNPYNNSIGIRFVVNVDPDMCYVKQTKTSYPKETIGVLYFYVMFVCLSLVATFRDLFSTVQEKGSYSERIIMSFSLKRTTKALFERKETRSSDIGCIHGIRSLATIALYIAHKLIPVSNLPYSNRAALTELAASPLSLVLRASLFYTDSFLLLSGVLTSYNMAKELSERGEIRWFCRLIARYIRLTPALLAVVLWYAYVMEHIGTGPQWNAVVKRNADICKESSWINILYIQNHLPFENMCATHTHQLALDMQLSLLAPVVVFFIQMKPILGIILIFFLLQVSATLRYFATSNNNLSLIIYHGMTLQDLYKTANLTYTSPVHRATPYLFGVTLGVVLRHTGKNVKIYKIFALMGWLIAGGLGMWSLFSPWRLARSDYEYDVEEATHYAVTSPILTALALCWMIFACFTDNGGFINRLLSSHWMIVFSKLSYSIYLTQFAVFFYNVGSVRYSSEFKIFKVLDPVEAVVVVLVSIVLTLIFDIPMQEAKNIVMESSDTLAVEDKIKSTIKESIIPDLSEVPEKKNNVKKSLRRSSTADISIADYDDEEDEDESEPNWNWNRGTFTKSEPREFMENGYDEPYRSARLKKLDMRRMTMVRSEAYDEWDHRGSSRRTSRSEEHSMDEVDRGSRNGYRYSNAGLDDDSYLHPRERHFSGTYTRSPMRDLDAPILRRSVSRERYLPKEPDTDRREFSRRPLITISREDDYRNSRSPRSSMPRFSEMQRSISSEGEPPDLHSRRSSNNFRRGSSAEPRISDEDDWEEEIKLRRSRFERVSSQERDRVVPPVVEEEDEWNTLRRRSSAEGKIALLKEPIRPGNMELWTVSKIQLGSSQEPDDEDFEDNGYSSQRRDYREQGPPLPEEIEEDEDQLENRKNSLATTSLPTSFEEEEEMNGHDFGLKKDSKMITIQDLSKLSPEEEMAEEKDWNKLDIKSGLFKRESIIKSQASEEDPEYLIPERPKLVEQEQEHPFKKAWQLQKSRSEEEGPAGFVVKDVRSTVTTLEKQKEEHDEKKEEQMSHEGPQSEEIIHSPDVSCEMTLVWQARSHETEDTKSHSKSESSSISLEWQDDDDDRYWDRRKSEEETWTWTEKDT